MLVWIVLGVVLAVAEGSGQQLRYARGEISREDYLQGKVEVQD